jgi:hypothetical protein
MSKFKSIGNISFETQQYPHSISSLAIAAGDTLGICLIGHAQSPKWGVYTCPE